MAQLVVRKLEPKVVRALRLRAARAGRSAEHEHREILRSALTGDERVGLKDLLLAMPAAGSDADFRRGRDKRRKVRLSVASRNTRDLARTGVRLVNPFVEAG